LESISVAEVTNHQSPSNFEQKKQPNNFPERSFFLFFCLTVDFIPTFLSLSQSIQNIAKERDGCSVAIREKNQAI